MTKTAPSRRRLLLLFAKGAVALLVLWFVARLLRDSLEDFTAADLRPDIALAGLAGVVYIAALLPMAWFWRRTLLALDQPSDWDPVLRAYYLGHLGKYVPGKALVVVLRTGALRSAGGQTASIAASVFAETLTMMAVGGVLASLLLALGASERQQPWLMPLALGLALLAAGPTLPPVMRWVISRLQAKDQLAKPADNPAGRLTWGLLAMGWLAALVTWVGLAGSLWLTIRGLDAGFPLTVEIAIHCLLAVSLPVVAGFLSLLPGGLVVRDGLMLALLTQMPGVDERTALATTILVRLIWLVAEACACVMLEGSRRLSG